MPTVAVGARLGSFVLADLLGSGGMGAVYRAVDTRLDRTVAIKVLTARVVDTARNQRWEREARTVSSLNHPHICTLYDVGDDEDVAYLVMEYLEGDTLAERLRRGAPPLDQALQWAIEIAGALDHAHRRGVVHRDLKPANIMLTRSGAKLLDFGIAKLYDSSAGSSPSATRAVDTVSEAGAIVGTLHYMAPEQVEARAIDARTDIFAFGSLLYEMATGRQAFEGASRAAVMAAIVGSDPPPISTVRSEVPALLDRLVARCLMKDPDDRWQTAADVKHVLECVVGGVAAPPARSSVGALADRRVRRGRFAWVAACLLFAMLGAVTATVWSKRVEVERLPAHFLVLPPEHSTFNPSHAFMAVSPDGRAIVFAASSRDGNTSLWIRPLGSPVARQLPGTDGAFQPFWSPDSRSIAFGAANGDRLKVIEVGTGLVQTVAGTPGRHGAWNRDNVMVLQTINRSELLRTSLSGSQTRPATRLDPARGETAHRWPQFLPDGRHFLFRASSVQAAHDGVIYAGALDSTDRVRLLTADSHAMYVAPGYLLFMRGAILFAQPFDASALRLTGEPVAVADQVDRNVGSGRGAFSASDTGVLAYRREGETDLAWFDHDGRRLSAVEPSGRYKNPALSPDERQLAIGRIDPESSLTDLWLIDLARGGISRFAASTDRAIWSPDGTRLAFTSLATRRGAGTPSTGRSFFQRASNGEGSAEELLPDLDAFMSPLGWTPDSRTLIFERGITKLDIGLLPLAGDRKPIRWIDSEFSVGQGRLSPNGRWMAYVSDESGKNEVYVRAFPSGAERRRLSVAGGIEPAWRPDGSELLYLAPDQMLMSVPIAATGAALESGTPVPLFKTRMGTLVNVAYTRNQYLVTRDGRILVNQPPESPSSTPMDVVIEWPARLKK